ncbi:MAG: hypothetical protein AAGA85_06025 [Bacteroidota bacterium]
MRSHRVLIKNRTLRYALLLAVLAGCKAASVTSTSAEYSEDLKVYRQPLPTLLPDAVPNESIGVDNGSLEGHIAPELDSVLTMIVDRNASRNSWDGYTIQMYSGLSREEAYEARDRAEELDLELAPKIEYYQPNYRVKGGQFFDRLAAYRVYKEVKQAFPSALLLPAKIPLTASDND